MKKNLVLIGMMAVGKTTIGRFVAKKLKSQFIDTDSNIEKSNSMTIKEIFDKKGEKFFRSEEKKEVLKSIKKNSCVIALGGGAFMNKTIREVVLKNAISIWLDSNIKILNKRINWNNKRPLLGKNNNEKKLNKLYEERKKIYELAKYKIKCDEISRNDIVRKIIILYERY